MHALPGIILAAFVAWYSSPISPQPVPQPAGELLSADSPRSTIEGSTFVAPAGWRIAVRGAATILEAPEGDSHIALVDVHAKDADAAVAAAWSAYNPDAKWPLKMANDAADRDGWTNIRTYDYLTSPNDKRDVFVQTRRAGDTWTVIVYDMAEAVGSKRGAQVALIFSHLFPKGYQRESFAGKKANKLDSKRIAELSKFVEGARQKLGVPGVSIGLIQDGKVIFQGGFGVRELGGKAKVDADTLYIIASNTKALTTLMLAKLVDEGKLTWETPVTAVLPSFKLGDVDTTGRVKIKHLICACTGLPRQDYEWLLQYKNVTPQRALATLATIQPTTPFGELYQYSNLLAAAGGFVGGHVAYPDLELGAAYEEAMRTRVFAPLRMTATTFDFQRALASNHAAAHAPNVDGKPARALMDVNYSIIPVRPAGGAWSNVRDLLKYVMMELREGMLRDGKRYISKDALLARRAPQVSIGKDVTYGMGLMVDTTYGVPEIHHGGDMIGYHSDMIWLPEQDVGAVILTNSDSGAVMRGPFRRKLLELLFDGKPEADSRLDAQTKSFFAWFAAERKRLTVPADAADTGKLGTRYAHEALGEIAVSHAGPATIFDFGEWKSEVASRHNPDGTVSFFTITPGVEGFEFVVGSTAKRTLIVRDAQHEYIFVER
jgi:CubicO group peptidase (beta-lactamase class C family)